MQPSPISSHSLLLLLVFATGCAGLLAAWLIIRAQQPMRASLRVGQLPADSVSGSGVRKRLERAWKRMVAAFNELRARREWRYQVPWILFCGEPGAGRSSVVESIRAGRNDAVGKREEKLQVAGTHWTFFDSGVVVDVDGGSLPDAASDDRRWNRVLAGLNNRRPERALDGIVLVMSARTLLCGARADVQRLAESCYEQLVSLQRYFEFQLPVYVIVSQCDSIAGFSAFWRAQPPSCRAEIFGWSNPCGLDNSYVPQWMDDAFDYMGGVLKGLQLRAAAADRPIADADEFFLAPQRFMALREGVSSVLAYLFRVSAYSAAPFFRGVYFVGAIDEGEARASPAAAHVAFVEQLFTDKIFAEQNLARPLRQAVWSRKAITRRLQYAAAAAALVLCVALFNACLQLRRQVEVGVASVDLIRHPQHASIASDGCVSKATVYELLSNISLLDVKVTTLVIPASWVDRRIENGGLDLVANAAFEKLIFPAFACELTRQARLVVGHDLLVHTAGESLTADRTRLRKYLDQVVAFERNRRYFARLAAYATVQQADELVADMEALTLYLYGDPLPDSVRHSRGYHRDALAKSVYNSPPAASRLDAYPG
ncbi:MAG TPA: type VI secretion system protein [Steroidobacteraceae bacterium]